MRQRLAKLLTQLADFINPRPKRTARTKLQPRFKYPPVDLIEARRLYETGLSINEVVAAVKGKRAAFDVKKLVRKTFKQTGVISPTHDGRRQKGNRFPFESLS